MDEYKNFTSLPPDQERTFVVYERFSRELGRKALRTGIIAAASFFVILVGLILGVKPDTKPKIKAKDIQTSESGARQPADEPDTASATKTKKDDEAEDWENGEGDDDDKKADDKKADDKKADDKKADGKKADDKKADDKKADK